jgi:predicted Zn-dependent protease
MLRSTTLPLPSLLHIRLGGLAAVTTLVVGGLSACGGTDETGQKPVEIVSAAEYVAPAVVDAPVAQPVGFVVPEDLTYATAESAFTAKRYSEATAMFGALADRKPENPWNHYMLGLSAWKSGDRDRAESAFTAALERDPKHLKSELNLTRVLLEMRRPEDARTHVEKGLAIDSTTGEGWRLLGRVQGELGQTEPAIEAYRKAIAIDEKDVWAMNNLGLVLIKAGRFEEALGPLARATEIDSAVSVFQNNLGMALERTGHYVAAASAYRAAVTADSSYTRAVVSLARVEELKESPTLVAVDLPGLARTFVQEVQTVGQGTVVMVPPPPAGRR